MDADIEVLKALHRLARHGHGTISVADEAMPDRIATSLATLAEWEEPRSSQLMMIKRASAA